MNEVAALAIFALFVSVLSFWCGWNYGIAFFLRRAVKEHMRENNKPIDQQSEGK